MKAINWIDKLKTVKHWDSDYRAAKELGLSRNTISNFRCGRNNIMDDETSVKVALAMGENPAAIIIDQVAERSKDPAISAKLRDVAASLCILCKQEGGPKRIGCASCLMRSKAALSH